MASNPTTPVPVYGGQIVLIRLEVLLRGEWSDGRERDPTIATTYIEDVFAEVNRALNDSLLSITDLDLSVVSVEDACIAHDHTSRFDVIDRFLGNVEDAMATGFIDSRPLDLLTAEADSERSMALAIQREFRRTYDAAHRSIYGEAPPEQYGGPPERTETMSRAAAQLRTTPPPFAAFRDGERAPEDEWSPISQSPDAEDAASETVRPYMNDDP